MTTKYKVWLEIEEIDESRDHYETVSSPCAALGTFASHDAAWAFADCIYQNQRSPKESFAVLWNVEDVQDVRPDLNVDQALKVLRKIEQKHDANSGISWDWIEYYANELYPSSSMEGES